MLLRWVSMCVWAGVAAVAVFWGLRLFTTPTAVPPQTQAADLAGAARGDLSRVLGVDALPQKAAAPPEAAADARFSLLGVVSPRGPASGPGGVALISVDGKPPKAYKLGAVVDGQNVLQNVSARGASLGPHGGPALVALNIPPPQAPATGQLPTPMPPPVQGAGVGGAAMRALPPPPNPAPPVGAPPAPSVQAPQPRQVPPPSQVPPQVDGRGNMLR